MDMKGEPRPTIRGVYVNSHIRALERGRGKAALEELHRRVGRSIDYSDSEAVPIGDEIEILEKIVEITSGEMLTKEECELRAGKLHFQNFTGTVLWLVLAPLVRFSLKFVLMQSGRIANRVFEGVTFVARDAGNRAVRVTLMNNDYPIEHFKGFFEAFIEYAGYKASVIARELGFGLYEYTLRWE